MKSLFRKITIVTAAASAVVWLACAATFAADSGGNVSLDLKDVDVRAAIESLFRGTGKNFVLEPDVSGVLPSVSIRDVSFEAALKSLARSAGLTFRQDGPIYVIQKKQASVDPGVKDSTPDPVDDTTKEETVIDKIPLSNTSATELLAMMNGQQSSGGMGGMGGMGGYGGMSGMGGMGGMGGMMGGMGGMGGGMGGMMGGMGGMGGGMGMMGGMGGMSGMSGMSGRSW